MAANHAVTLYAVLIALFAFSLAFVVIWSRRELRMRLIALALSLGMAPVAFFAFSQLPGKPDDITAEEFREAYHCARVLHADIRERVGILMLVKKTTTSEPEFLFVSWNMQLGSSLQKSMRTAKLNGKGSIIFGGKACATKGKKGKEGDDEGGAGKMRRPGSSGQEQNGEESFIFEPDPIPPLPEKNYGPLYEGPIEMPQQQH
jgi:hypothetical protein